MSREPAAAPGINAFPVDAVSGVAAELLGCLRNSPVPEHVEPKLFIGRAEDSQLPEDLASELDRCQTARGDDAAVTDCGYGFVDSGSRILRNVLGDIARHVAGVTPIVEQTGARNRKCPGTDGSDRHASRARIIQ